MLAGLNGLTDCSVEYGQVFLPVLDSLWLLESIPMDWTWWGELGIRERSFLPSLIKQIFIECHCSRPQFESQFCIFFFEGLNSTILTTCHFLIYKRRLSVPSYSEEWDDKIMYLNFCLMQLDIIWATKKLGLTRFLVSGPSWPSVCKENRC